MARPANNVVKETIAMVEERAVTYGEFPKVDGLTLVREDGDALWTVLNLLVELLTLFGFDTTGYSLKPAFEEWGRHVAVVGWMKWTKYKLAAYFAYHWEQEIPSCPIPNCKDNAGDVLTGRACRFMRRYLATHPDAQRLELTFSVLQLKKGLPRPGKAALKQSINDTFAALTTYTPPIAATATEDEEVGSWDGSKQQVRFQEVVDAVKYTAREVFRGHKLDLRDLLSAFMPSMSANYNNTRSKLGMFGDLVSSGQLEVSVPEIEDISLDTLNSREPRERYVHDEEHISNARDPVRTYRVNNYSMLNDQFSSVYLKVLQEAETEEPLVLPVALAEALKVRVISKGPKHTYFVLKPVQKFMWNVIRSHPVFRLVGETVTSDVLNEMMGNWMSPSEAFLSGDYKAATDNIRAELSEACWLALAEECNFPANLTALGLRALTGHTMEHPETGKQLPQAAGQLMGSIISFPILCLINAAVCRMAMSVDHPWGLISLGVKKMEYVPGELHIRRAVWYDVPRLLINGDDCLFPATQRVRSRWKLLSRMAGLEESIGKTYYSRRFANINSTNFLCVYDGDEVRFEITGYVNFGLIRGMKRSGGTGAVGYLDPDADLGQRLTKLFETSPPWLSRDALWKKFRRHNQDALEFFSSRNIPWFVPRQYGGVGLPAVDDDTLCMSRTDKRIVRAMITGLYPRAPSPQEMREPAALLLHQFALDVVAASGVDIGQVQWSLEKKDELDLRPLYLWSALLRPRELKYYMYTDDSESNCPTVQAEAWQERYNAGELHPKTAPDLLWRAIEQNQKVWRFYTKRIDRLPPPFEELLPRYATRSFVLLYE